MKERNIVKTTIWMIASALVFVAATVAWFGLNSQSSVGPASTNIESKGMRTTASGQKLTLKAEILSSMIY